MSDPYIGEIRLFAGSFAPRDWLFCDGRLLTIDGDNEALFQLIGTTYGGDGESTFAIPDLRGRAPIHQGAGAQTSFYSLGEAAGTETVTLTVLQTQDHTHRLMGENAAGTSRDPSGRLPARPSPSGALYKTSPGSVVPMATGIIQPQGLGNQPHNNRQPYQAVSFIICVAGIFPPQP